MQTGGPRDLLIPLEVEPALDGYRLDRFLALRLKRLSRVKIQTIIANGQVSRAGTSELLLRPSQRVRVGQRLTLRRPRFEEPPVPLHFGTVHRDDDLLVLDKPAGLPVHPSARYHEHTLTALLRRELGGGHGWEMAHRLDRETSGLIVFGRRTMGASVRGQKGSAGRLKRAFQERQVDKRYLAVVHGCVDAPVRIDIPLGMAVNSKIKIKMGPRSLDHGGVPATTEIEPLHLGMFRERPITLVRATPRTGRQHQIRVHLAEIGHGIVGDKLYGLDEAHFLAIVEDGEPMATLEAELGFPRHALHAHELVLPHPRTGERMRFTAPWPSDLSALVPEACAR